jgi:hypothetical protein
MLWFPSLQNQKTYYYFFLLLFLLERINAFLQFSVVYTDSDQVLMWQAALDLKSGIFHSPCFYGQAYNPLIESALAVPIALSGIKISAALPLVTTTMAILPVLLFSQMLKRHGWLAAAFPFLLWLLLSPEYCILTSISRGFVTGIFFFSIGFYFVTYNSAVIRFLAGILTGFSIYANPNCVLLFPLFFLLPELKQQIIKLLPASIGFFIGLSSLYFNHHFYAEHPEMVVYPSPSLQFSFHNFMSVVGKLDNYFDFISPVFWRLGYLSLLIFPLISIWLFKYNFRKESFFLLFLFALILLSFFVSKVADGSNSVFFSGARFYLAYPFLIGTAFILLLRHLREKQRIKIYLVGGMLALLAFFIKISFSAHLQKAH